LGIGRSGFVGIHGLLIRFTLTCVYIGVWAFSWEFGAFLPYTMSESDIGHFYFKLERFFYWAFILGTVGDLFVYSGVLFTRRVRLLLNVPCCIR
jgi:hypothetical protein